MSAAVERARVRRRLSKLIMGALLEIARRRGVEPRELSEDALTLERLAMASWAARDADMAAERPKQWPAPPPVTPPPERRPERTDLPVTRPLPPPPLPAGVSPSSRPTAPPPAGWEPREDTPIVPRDSYPQIEMSEVDFEDMVTPAESPRAKHAADALSARLRPKR